MDLEKLVHLAFGNIAPHIANLESFRNLVQSLLMRVDSQQEFIQELQSQMESAEVTMRTDIRILINEIERILRKESTG